MSKSNEHGFTSTAEYIVLRREEIKAEYDERKNGLKLCLSKGKESVCEC